jgi:hypothetical protein
MYALHTCILYTTRTQIVLNTLRTIITIITLTIIIIIIMMIIIQLRCWHRVKCLMVCWNAKPSASDGQIDFNPRRLSYRPCTSDRLLLFDGIIPFSFSINRDCTANNSPREWCNCLVRSLRYSSADRNESLTTIYFERVVGRGGYMRAEHNISLTGTSIQVVCIMYTVYENPALGLEPLYRNR